jgi:Flp pilus assembly protein TadD
MKSSRFITLILILSAIILPASAQSVDETVLLYNQGVKLHSEGKNKEAIEAFKKYLQFKSNSAPAFNSLGVALSDSGIYDEAVTNKNL